MIIILGPKVRRSEGPPVTTLYIYIYVHIYIYIYFFILLKKRHFICFICFLLLKKRFYLFFIELEDLYLPTQILTGVNVEHASGPPRVKRSELLHAVTVQAVAGWNVFWNIQHAYSVMTCSVEVPPENQCPLELAASVAGGHIISTYQERVERPDSGSR